MYERMDQSTETNRIVSDVCEWLSRTDRDAARNYFGDRRSDLIGSIGMDGRQQTNLFSVDFSK